MAKIWTKPLLIELYRGRFEENVLCYCKSSNQGGKWSNKCYDSLGSKCYDPASS